MTFLLRVNRRSLPLNKTGYGVIIKISFIIITFPKALYRYILYFIVQGSLFNKMMINVYFLSLII